MTKSFSEVKKYLSPDGALRDFYIKGINPSDWERFLSFVKENIVRYTFHWYDKEMPLPKSYNEIKKMKEDNPTILTIWIGEQTICCYFFMDTEIELDFKPNDIKDEQKWNNIVLFFQSLVNIIGKKGIITQENMEEYIIDEIRP